MVVSNTSDIQATVHKSYDRMSELKAFDDTKAGVKGLIDAGITKVPQIFILPPKNRPESTDTCETQFIFPVIDLEGIDKDPIRHKEIVDKVRDASETWGFFQVVNHGIPAPVLEAILQGTRQFFEQDVEVKKKYYTRDSTKKVFHASNFDLYSPSVPAANWRDSIFFSIAPNHPSPEEFPRPCREILTEYSKHIMELGKSLFELLSEGLGLNPSHLNDIDCAEGLSVLGHYYPACPKPELTMGTSKHSDNDFITVLLQDHIGGLQVLHQNQWVDVPPTPGALVVNIGDLLQASILFFSKPSTINKRFMDLVLLLHASFIQVHCHLLSFMDQLLNYCQKIILQNNVQPQWKTTLVISVKRVWMELLHCCISRSNHTNVKIECMMSTDD